MSQYDEFNGIVEDVDRRIRTVKWAPDRIGSCLGNRTVRDIIDSGEVPYRFCFDKALVVAYFAVQNGIETTLVMMGLNKPFRETSLRAGIEIMLDGSKYVFHPSHRGNDFNKGEMPYKLLHKLLPYKILRTPMKDSQDLSWLQNFGMGIKGLEESFPEANIADMVKSIKKSNQ